MHVISYKAIREFKASRPDSGPALDNWYRVSTACKWTSLAEVKQVLASADWVKPYVVFNIAGNKYRLIARVNYQTQRVFVLYLLTHTEYDRGAWKQ